MTRTEPIALERGPDHLTLRCRGTWRVEKLAAVEKSFESLVGRLPERLPLRLDVSGIEAVDTAGMTFFIAMRRHLRRGRSVKTVGVSPAFCRMFRLLLRYQKAPAAPSPRTNPFVDALVSLGEAGERFVKDFVAFLAFLGAATLAFFDNLLHPGAIRFKESASHIYKAGVTALPIVALSSFLVGVVIAYQSAVQLQKYGANIFIVDMIGISIPRELAPLITAIIVAGRSGSAYTAQIGVMKITEELDAMKTMGFGIFRFVVLPRIYAMVVALPLLIFFADIVGIYAGMLVADAQLGINPAQFFDRLQEAVEPRHYLIGLFKAPFFAFIIAAIGCFRGFQVTGDTESVGRYTTMSVVNAIFLVVALDALFSVIFTELGI
ncbi:ABC transporter permease [Hydrogenimonas sp.]